MFPVKPTVGVRAYVQPNTPRSGMRGGPRSGGEGVNLVDGVAFIVEKDNPHGKGRT